jgi:ABC-2 type transport system ATP-binding protein
MMIDICNISKTYNNQSILKSISLQILEGSTYCLLGRNGAGKSTFLNILLDLIEADSGKITFNNKSLKDDGFNIRKEMGVLLDTNSLIEELDGYSYLLFIGKLYKVEDKVLNRRIENLINYFFESKEEIEKPISKFSTGMKKKIGFCASILHEPNILILDEPFSGLDPVSSHFLTKLLKKYQNGKRIILLSSHNLSYAQEISTNIGVIENNKLLFNGTLSEFTNKGRNELEDSLLEILESKNSTNKDLEWV